MPILTTLAERGHDTTVVTLSDELAQLARIDIDASALHPVIERNQLQDWRQRSVHRAALSVLDTLAQRAGAEAPDLAHAIARQNPDVLLIDVNCWGAAVAAEASGRPWAVYSPYLLPLPSREVPPFGLGLSPRHSPLGAARDALLARLASRTLDRTAMPAINALRAEYGLPALDRFSDSFARPDVLLALTAEGFEYPRRDWPANVRLVGPIDWAPPRETPAWLADAPHPLVLVTCSTERQRDESLIRVALKALPAAGMSVIATTAAHDPGAFEAPPPSRVVRFLPHAAVLQRAACVVCHGGMGIVQKALVAGVPVVVVPFGRDQFETARRVEVAGAGVRLSPRRLTAHRLAHAVRAALERRAGALRVSRAFAAAGGPIAAAEAIEEIGGHRRPPQGD